MLINLGNVAALIRSKTAPTKKFLLWAKLAEDADEEDLDAPVQLQYYNFEAGEWQPLFAGNGGGGGEPQPPAPLQYSETRYETGKLWHDGRTIYGQVIQGSVPNPLPENGLTVDFTLPNNLDIFISANGLITQGDNFWQVGGDGLSWLNSFGGFLTFQVSPSASFMQGANYHIIIEYIEQENGTNPPL